MGWTNKKVFTFDVDRNNGNAVIVRNCYHFGRSIAVQHVDVSWTMEVKGTHWFVCTVRCVDICFFQRGRVKCCSFLCGVQ